MDVNEPEVLRRGMYGENPDRPEITETSDYDAPTAIPLDLQEIIHAPMSRDIIVETPEKTHIDLAVDVEKVAEENPQSRFRILDVPAKKPGVCALCGDAGGDGRQFVDFGKSVEWYGVVYFCTVCVTEAAKLLGFMSGEEYERLFKNYEKTLLDYGNQKLDTEYVQRKLNAALVLVHGCTCTGGNLGQPLSEIPEAELVESDNPDGDDSEAGSPELSESEPSLRDDGTTDSDEPNPDESSPVEGPDDVSGSASSDEPESKPVRSSRRGSKSSG